MLAALDIGDSLYNGGNAAGRRVWLPWGGDTFQFSFLNSDGLTIMRKAIQWAGGGSSGLKVLFAVANPSSLTTREAGRNTQFESWGYTVTLIDDADSAANYAAALASTDVVYVGSSISSSVLSGKLEDTTVGIVNEPGLMIDNFGLNGGSASVTDIALDIVEPTHYIALDFSGSTVTIFSASTSMTVLGSTDAPGLVTVAEPAAGGSNPSVVATLETGAERYDSAPSAGRRVHLPFASAEISQLTADGLTLMRRSIEWAAEQVENTAPDVSAGPDQTIFLPTVAATLAGTVADDGLPDPPASVTTTWSQISGPAGASFDNPSAVDTIFRFTLEGVYVLRLTVDDSELAVFDEVTITVQTTPEMYVNDIAMSWRKQGNSYYGQATVWIKDDGGANVPGALVSGTWSGVVSGTAAGSTDAGGKIMLESPGKKNGGTYTFTVTNVTKSGCIYNPALNVEMSDTIIAP